ncbi:Zinc finger BED domain-containing protein DAYSLEEPER [Sesamum alatum]|uniref:Zinc finger BED domain-containing protein DAYSLEEPER n=1 Tax=Sesamum alatum TaxID=300844 RepID=A0AAE2CFD3_9LAMI|nr:Zinc finger BED domain-containing protein DAYSLEEPER [Sesamum alatum]
MARDLKSKFDKYWECYSIVLTFAIVVDPQYKLEFIEFYYKKLDVSTSYEKVNDLKEQMPVLFEEYLCAEFDSYKSQCANARSQSQLDLYLGETLIDRKQFLDRDVLDYWKGNNARYPELTLMACDVLSIPMTTVASESGFSHGGSVIGKFRSSILPTNVKAIL